MIPSKKRKGRSLAPLCFSVGLQDPLLRAVSLVYMVEAMLSSSDRDALPVCLAPWVENPYRLVSLWDMLPFLAYDFCRASGIVAQFYAQINSGILPTSTSLGLVASELGMLERACEPLGLTNTLAQLRRLKPIFTTNEPQTVVWDRFARDVMEVHTRLIDELQARMLFCLNSEKTHYYRTPLTGWERVIGRFPETQMDVEEAARCFALERYAACVFHCVQLVEGGLIALGLFMSVKDPKSGWTATSNELDRIVKKKFSELTPFETQHLTFFKQMHATVTALQDAWRNKISHTQGRLVVMTSDFPPFVAEEILIASRGFMRRLATDLPK